MHFEETDMCVCVRSKIKKESKPLSLSIGHFLRGREFLRAGGWVPRSLIWEIRKKEQYCRCTKASVRVNPFSLCSLLHLSLLLKVLTILICIAKWFSSLQKVFFIVKLKNIYMGYSLGVMDLCSSCFWVFSITFLIMQFLSHTILKYHKEIIWNDY